MLGDTALAVNPEDERYASLVGGMAVLPIVGREIPIIADEYVEKEFGTGVVKITPAHDPNDFEVGRRHKLEIIKVMDLSLIHIFFFTAAFAYFRFFSLSGRIIFNIPYCTIASTLSATEK